jgi:4a-hydroxytetrahydrobiopterin dehydratase
MATLLSGDQVAHALGELPGWQAASVDGEPRLTRTFAFSDYAAALAFAVHAGALAERHDHHPALLVEWGRVTVSWWTHTAGGITDLDVEMARRTAAAAEAP